MNASFAAPRRFTLGRLIGWHSQDACFCFRRWCPWYGSAIYRFVPPPITFTMIGNAFDGRGIHKDWMPLIAHRSRTWRALRSAGEDSRFCTHHGFDVSARSRKPTAAQRARRQAASAADRRSASRRRKMLFLMAERPFLRAQGVRGMVHGPDRGLMGQASDHGRFISTSPRPGIGTYGVDAGAQNDISVTTLAGI